MSDSQVRTYVLDTSVLLSDPWACTRFAEHEVVVPLVVISELEGKRHHHELGWFARQALRMFDDLRLEHGRLDQPIPVGTQGGSLQVELNHVDQSVLPTGFRTDTNDHRILACAANLAAWPTDSGKARSRKPNSMTPSTHGGRQRGHCPCADWANASPCLLRAETPSRRQDRP